MKHDEIKTLVAMTLANFPNMQERHMSPTVALWQQMLSDIPFNVAKAALIKVLATARFWPTAGEIREASVQLTSPNILSAPEAWAQVIKAIRYDWRSDELDPVVRKAIEGFGGLNGIGYSENIDVVRGQFLKVYDQYAARERETALVPASVRELIGETVKSLPVR